MTIVSDPGWKELEQQKLKMQLELDSVKVWNILEHRALNLVHLRLFHPTFSFLVRF